MTYKHALLAAFLLTSCDRDPALPSYGVVPDFSLTDQSGREFYSAKKLTGSVWVANFIFTNCGGPCPRMSSQMKQVRDATARGNTRYVSFTIDPARDTPQVLAAYGRRFHADPDEWYLLTGPQEKLHQLKRYVFKLGNVDGSLNHSSRFVLVDQKARIRGFYDSSDASSFQKLLADVKKLARG